MVKRKFEYRVRYWVQLNDEFGEWNLTGLTDRNSAEKIAEELMKYHNPVMVIRDDDGVVTAHSRNPRGIL